MIETTFVKEYSKLICQMYDDGWELLEDIAEGNASTVAERILEYLRMD